MKYFLNGVAIGLLCAASFLLGVLIAGNGIRSQLYERGLGHYECDAKTGDRVWVYYQIESEE